MTLPASLCHSMRFPADERFFGQIVLKSQVNRKGIVLYFCFYTYNLPNKKKREKEILKSVYMLYLVFWITKGIKRLKNKTPEM